MKLKRVYIAEVYDLVRIVPQGRVTTYGAIADYLQLGSARMVGWALNMCHSDPSIPAHRVVNRKGELSGRVHFETPTTMQERLVTEGVEVRDDKVQNFESYLWQPIIELEKW